MDAAALLRPRRVRRRRAAAASSRIALGIATGYGQFNLSWLDPHRCRRPACGPDSLSWSRRIATRAYLSLGVLRARDAGGRDTAAQFSLIAARRRYDRVSLNGSRGRARPRGREPAPAIAGRPASWYVESALERSEHAMRAGGRVAHAVDIADARCRASRCRRHGLACRGRRCAGLARRAEATHRGGSATCSRVVDTGAAPDVTITRENRPQGRRRRERLFPGDRTADVSETNRRRSRTARAAALEVDARRPTGSCCARIAAAASSRQLSVRRGRMRPVTTASSTARRRRLEQCVLSCAERRRPKTVGYDGLVHVEPQVPWRGAELRGAFGQAAVSCWSTQRLLVERGHPR